MTSPDPRLTDPADLPSVCHRLLSLSRVPLIPTPLPSCTVGVGGLRSATGFPVEGWVSSLLPSPLLLLLFEPVVNDKYTGRNTIYEICVKDKLVELVNYLLLSFRISLFYTVDSSVSVTPTPPDPELDIHELVGRVEGVGCHEVLLRRLCRLRCESGEPPQSLEKEYGSLDFIQNYGGGDPRGKGTETS